MVRSFKISPDTRLRDELRDRKSGMTFEQMVQRGTEKVRDRKEDYGYVLRRDLDSLRTKATTFLKARDDHGDIWTEMFDLAFNVAGQAAGFDFDRISQVARSLAIMLDRLPEGWRHHDDVTVTLSAHVDALVVIALREGLYEGMRKPEIDRPDLERAEESELADMLDLAVASILKRARA